MYQSSRAEGFSTLIIKTGRCQEKAWFCLQVTDGSSVFLSPRSLLVYYLCYDNLDQLKTGKWFCGIFSENTALVKSRQNTSEGDDRRRRFHHDTHAEQKQRFMFSCFNLKPDKRNDISENVRHIFTCVNLHDRKMKSDEFGSSISSFAAALGESDMFSCSSALVTWLTSCVETGSCKL